jgi:hypothetical protein
MKTLTLQEIVLWQVIYVKLRTTLVAFTDYLSSSKLNGVISLNFINYSSNREGGCNSFVACFRNDVTRLSYTDKRIDLKK